MTIENENIALWTTLSFRTRCYRKNFDLVSENENIITEYVGSISELRLKERKLPLIIGEYTFSVWNVRLGKMLEVDIMKLVKEFELEDTYSELFKVINNKEFDINQYDKVVFIHGFVLRADYRKKGVTEEFIETMYRDFYDDNTAIVMLVKPIQDNVIDNDYYLNHHKSLVEINNQINDYNENESQIFKIPAYEYYSLGKLHDKDDIEYNEYKLFAIADRCGFIRIGESHLFQYNKDKTVVRMLIKMKKIKQSKII